MSKFAKLVPREVAQGVADYQGKLAQLVSLETERVKQATEKAKCTLLGLNLPGSLEVLDNSYIGLPPRIKEKMSFIQERGGRKHLEELVAESLKLANENMKILKDSSKLIEDEENRDGEMRQQFGAAWSCAPSKSINGTLKSDLEKYTLKLAQVITHAHICINDLIFMFLDYDKRRVNLTD